MMKKSSVTLLGAGLVGSLFAVFLAKRGFEVHIFEKRSDPRSSTKDQGRSINLALSHRGWKALKAVGLEEQVRKLAIPMKGRMIHDHEGNQNLQAYSKEGKSIYSISRLALNKLLIDTADAYDNIHFHFNHNCLAIQEEEITFFHTKKQKIIRVKPNLLIGTDGANSVVRKRINQLVKAEFEETFLAHGYKELSIPAGKNNNFQLDQNALHIWPRKQFMLIALPNPDKTFTCTLFLAYEGKQSFDQLTTLEAVNAFFEKEFSDVKTLIPDLGKQFFENPTSFLSTVKTYPWHYEDKFLIMGDAAHAIVPFYGQGMNAGFEDCTVLAQLLEDYNNNWAKVLPAFSEHRKKDGDAIATLALNNFVEMRDSVVDPNFLAKKQKIAELYEQDPKAWMPLYEMVTFSDYSYSEALQKGKEQEQKILAML